jgi:hypothetical protein
MKQISFIAAACILFASCNNEKTVDKTDSIVATGQMPNLTKDREDNLHLAYGSGDSIMYSFSNNNGKSFSAPLLISVLPKLAP